MKWQIYLIMSLVIIGVANAQIDIKLAEGQTVSDSKGNTLSGKEVILSDDVGIVNAPCNSWCQIKKILGFEAVVPLPTGNSPALYPPNFIHPMFGDQA